MDFFPSYLLLSGSPRRYCPRLKELPQHEAPQCEEAHGSPGDRPERPAELHPGLL